MLEQGLLLAVRLWGRMPAERVAECALLPACAPPPPADFFTRTTRNGEHNASEAAAAFFSRGHLQVCALRAALCVHVHCVSICSEFCCRLLQPHPYRALSAAPMCYTCMACAEVCVLRMQPMLLVACSPSISRCMS